MEDPLFISGESGDGELDVMRYIFDPKERRHWPKTWDEVKKAVREIAASNRKDFRTVVFDGMGALEKLAIAHVCSVNKWTKGLSEAGYGKGDSALLAEMTIFLKLVEECWAPVVVDGKEVAPGLNICFVAHSKVGKQKNPAGEEYSRYCPALTDSNAADVSGLLVGWCDLVLFVEVEVNVTKSDKRTIGVGTGRHVFRTKIDPAWVAKTRYDNVPETMDLNMRALLDRIEEGQSVERMTKKAQRLLGQIGDLDKVKKIADWMALPGPKDIKLLNQAAARLEAEIEEGNVAQQQAA